jgi:hypothetical protein
MAATALRLQRIRSAISGKLISLSRSNITILSSSPFEKYFPCDLTILASVPKQRCHQ